MQTLRRVPNEEIKILLDEACKESEYKYDMTNKRVREAYFDGMRAGVDALQKMLEESGVIPKND